MTARKKLVAKTRAVASLWGGKEHMPLLVELADAIEAADAAKGAAWHEGAVFASHERDGSDANEWLRPEDNPYRKNESDE